ncbi:MAG: aldehyde ferredoxin oxidoreductase N-terminal domain-containing protein [Spirochaetota bacterium]
MQNSNPLEKVLYIDLTHKRYRVESKPGLFSQNIGGAGAAIQLLHENCPQGADPLGPENPIIFAVGPLNALFPLASKTVAMFRSPHTGNLGESHCGGRSAVAIRMAGYAAIVIKGSSDTPIYLAVHGNRVYFRDAGAMWGMRSSFTVGRIVRENEPQAGLRTIMRIGTGGEHLVTYASVTTESYRHFGRLGLGAVFGSKKLKALVVSGKSSLHVENTREYRHAYDEIYHSAVGSDMMQKYHDLGTPENVLPLNELGGLPVRNLASAKFEEAQQLSGENLAEKYLGRRLSCSHCPVGCIHIAALREPYEEEAYFYKTSMISYDYEPIYSLGTMLGISDSEGYLKLMDRIEFLGVDAMSTGVVLAWATEARQRGIVSRKHTCDISLQWGDWKSYIDAVHNIVEQPNDFFASLARGVDYASSRYGGEEFALSMGGNEMPGYHTGPACHAGYLAGARHSHLDNAGYSIDQKELVNKKMSSQQLAQKLLAEERWRQVLSSLVVCFFARKIYTPEVVSRALKISGCDYSDQDISRIGEKILAEKYAFKTREGFSADKLRIPGRILETPSPLGKIDSGYLREVVESFTKKALQ